MRVLTPVCNVLFCIDIVFLGIDIGITVLDYFWSCFSLKELCKGKIFKDKDKIKSNIEKVKVLGPHM